MQLQFFDYDKIIPNKVYKPKGGTRCIMVGLCRISTSKKTSGVNLGIVISLEPICNKLRVDIVNPYIWYIGSINGSTSRL